jgi:hypothetical protein
MSRHLRRVLTAASIALWVVIGATPAVADHLEAETSVPETVRAGDVVEMRVVVREAGTKARVPGATVVAERDASIAGFSGRVVVARAVTDELGVATLRWTVTSGSAVTVVLAYSAVGDAQLESTPQSVITVAEGPQLVRSRVGVRIPGFGAWVLIALLVGVWSTIQYAMLGPIRVEQLALDADHSDGEQPA